MAEQGSHKPRVGGSSPPAATTLRARRSHHRHSHCWSAVPPPQTRTMAIPLALSQADTFSQPAGSRSCHAVSAELRTSTRGRLCRHTRPTNHARSVLELSSARSADGGVESVVAESVASTMTASRRCRQAQQLDQERPEGWSDVQGSELSAMLLRDDRDAKSYREAGHVELGRNADNRSR